MDKKQRYRKVDEVQSEADKADEKTDLLEHNLKTLEGLAHEEIDMGECMKTLASCAASLGARIKIEAVDGGKKRIVLDGYEPGIGVKVVGVKKAPKSSSKKREKESIEYLKIFTQDDTDYLENLLGWLKTCQTAEDVIYLVAELEDRFGIVEEVIKSLKFFEKLSVLLKLKTGSSPSNLLRVYNRRHELYREYNKR